jgi:hypothetical protein
MLNLFRAIIARVKALLATSAALELEAEALARHAERQADLLRLAGRYEEEGLHAVARALRQQAEALDLRQPLADWQAEEERPALPAAASTPEPAAHLPHGRRKPR